MTHHKTSAPATEPGHRGAPAGGRATADRAARAGAEHHVDEDLVRAAELVIATQFGSATMLQRKLKISLARAINLMSDLESAGIVAPGFSSRSHDVVVRPDQLDDALQRLRGAR